MKETFMVQRSVIESLEPRLMLSATSFVECLDLTTTAGLIQLEYDMPALQVELMQSDGAGALSHLTLGDSQLTGGTGQVLLPVVTAQVVIPYGYQMADVLIETGEEIFLDGQYTLKKGDMLVATDGVTTSTMEWIDRSEGYEVVALQQKRGVDILVLNLYPVTYSVQAGILSYFDSMSMSVQLTPGTATSGESHEIIYRIDEIRPLADNVDNPGALDSYEAAPAMEAGALGTLVNPADSYDYLIITNDALAGASADYDMADFVTHKESLGFDVAVVTVEDIYANYSGFDQPDQIRNFIIDAYNGWETDYVLLAGDASVIPLRKLLVPGIAPDLIDSDFYYQCLDRDFNADGDGYLGEYPSDNVDFYAEVYIGRAGFNNVAYMSNWIYKTISYENSINDPYRYGVEMVGEQLDTSWYAKNSLEYLRTHYFMDPIYNVDTLYAADGAWSSSDIIADMNSNEYAIYNHLGHGNGGTVFATNQAVFDANLTNDKFFFAYSQACWSGYLGGGSVAEHLTSFTRHGAAAVIFNSSYGWYYSGSTNGPSDVLNQQFWDALANEGINRLGAMNADSHEDNLGQVGTNMVQAVIYCTTLFGDPSLNVISMDLSILTDVDLPIAYQDEYYEVALEPRNGTGPYTWSVTSGDLPDGLALGANTGVISGTPTGTLDETFTVQVLDTFTSDTAEKEFNLAVIDRLEFLVSALPDGYQDVQYDVSLDVQGGTGPYTWTLTDGSLPDGVTLDSGTGLIDGVPTTVGTFVFTVDVSDSGVHGQTISQQFTFDVALLLPGIYGQVFNDVNDNGQRDAGEVGLNGWTIEVVDMATGLVVDTTVSAAVDSNLDGSFDAELECGLYSFTGLAAGNYQVRQINKTGWDPTTLVTYPGRLFALRNVGSDLTIYENDPVTGDVLNTFPAPQPTMFSGMQGLAVGPGSLYFIDSGDPGAQPILYELNLETGAVLDSDTIPGDLPAMTMGLGVIDCLVYVQYSMTEIFVFNCATDTVINTLTVPALLSGGLTAAPDLGLLFGSNTSGDIYAIDPSSGAVIDTFTPGVGPLNGGLAYVNGELIGTTLLLDPSNLVHRFDPLTGVKLGTLELDGTGRVAGLGGDSVALPAYNSYRIRMAADQIVQGKDFGNEVQLLGDVDCSGVVDAGDIDMLFAGFGDAGMIDPLADLDNDGDADTADVDLLVHGVLSSEYGDANLLGQVDTTDLTIVATNFGASVGWAGGDFNGDGLVNTTDLTILATNFGFVAGPPEASLSSGPPPGEALSTDPAPDQVASPAPSPVLPADAEPMAIELQAEPIFRIAPPVVAAGSVLAVAEVGEAPSAAPSAPLTDARLLRSPVRSHGRLKTAATARSGRFRLRHAAASAAAEVDFSSLMGQELPVSAANNPVDPAVAAELDADLVDILDEADGIF